MVLDTAKAELMTAGKFLRGVLLQFENYFDILFRFVGDTEDLVEADRTLAECSELLELLS